MPDGTTTLPKRPTELPLTVRVAGTSDEAALLNLFIDAHADNQFAAMSVTRMAEAAHRWCAQPDRDRLAVVGVIDGDDGSLAGCAAMVVFQPWFSEDWAIEEQIIFVRPEYRTPERAADLKAFCKWFAEKMEMTLYLGVRSKDKVEIKSELFARDFTPCGGLFFHEGKRA